MLEINGRTLRLKFYSRISRFFGLLGYQVRALQGAYACGGKAGGEIRDKIKFCKLNTAENRRLAISQKVLGLPTIAMYKDGAKVEELTQDKATPDNIEEMLKRYV